jgi:hypothetical protein
MVEEMKRTKELSICWIVLGERQAYLPGPMERLGSVRISGACALDGGRLNGFVKFRSDERIGEETTEPIGEKRF